MYKKVLLATDLMAENKELIAKTQGLVKEWGSQLGLVHIVEPLPSYGYAYVGGADIEIELIKESKEKVATIGKELGVVEDNQYVEVGPTKMEVLKVAEEGDFDLIIVGSHGRHGLGVLLGSTANAVLHGAKCDVLTIRLR